LRTQIRRAKWKHIGLWYGLALLAGVGIGAIFEAEAYWLWPILTGLFAGMVAASNTTGADRVYRKAYEAGLAMGVVVAYDAARHARHHAEHGGGEGCEVGVARAVVPHVWEHKFVQAEIDTFSYTSDADEDPDATPTEPRP